MNDRELLELAAKAAGINYHQIDEKGVWYTPSHMHESAYCWNPLTDDGDALRLAVKLRLLGLSSITSGEQWRIDYYVNGSDYATRRAIVRAAADIGKGMK